MKKFKAVPGKGVVANNHKSARMLKILASTDVPAEFRKYENSLHDYICRIVSNKLQDAELLLQRYNNNGDDSYIELYSPVSIYDQFLGSLDVWAEGPRQLMNLGYAILDGADSEWLKPIINSAYEEVVNKWIADGEFYIQDWWDIIQELGYLC